MRVRGMEIDLMVFYRATHAESIEERHSEFMTNMAEIGPPLGFKDMELPPTPDCGKELGAGFGKTYPHTKGLRYFGFYIYRGERYHYEDKACFDDSFSVIFKTSNKRVDYHTILHEAFPQVIKAYRGYRAKCSYDLYNSTYCGGFERTNPIYNRLLTDKSISVDGRNNIYTITPAHYWDEELCQRALGFGPDEVVRRLEGKAVKVERLMNGVYVIFNDNPALTYEDYVAMNEYFKPLLGLHYE